MHRNNTPVSMCWCLYSWCLIHVLWGLFWPETKVLVRKSLWLQPNVIMGHVKAGAVNLICVRVCAHTYPHVWTIFNLHLFHLGQVTFWQVEFGKNISKEPVWFLNQTHTGTLTLFSSLLQLLCWWVDQSYSPEKSTKDKDGKLGSQVD